MAKRYELTAEQFATIRGLLPGRPVIPDGRRKTITALSMA
jgi:hypothetical protein